MEDKSIKELQCHILVFEKYLFIVLCMLKANFKQFLVYFRAHSITANLSPDPSHRSLGPVMHTISDQLGSVCSAAYCHIYRKL